MAVDLPLKGVTVVELGDSAAAPFCGQILGDLGAEIIKIERPDGGDPSRHWGPAFWHGTAATFQSINRNKRSAVIDLKDAAARARLRRLILERADVFFHNLRPGTAEDYGLGGEQLLGENPRLVYCALGAFGHKGPLSKLPGYDPLMQAFAGIMSVTGEDDRPPVRVGVPVIDFGTGLWCAIGILAALNRRHATGAGAIVDASLYETGIAWMSVVAAGFNAAGDKPPRLGTGAPFTVPYRAFETADGYLVVGCANDRLFVKLAEALGHPEWVRDARFADNLARIANRETVDGMIGEILITKPRRHWQDILEAAGVPNAPLQDIAEVLAHPQTKALDMVQQTPEGDMDLVSLPLSFDRARPPIRRRPPALGAHTDEIFGDED